MAHIFEKIEQETQQIIDSGDFPTESNIKWFSVSLVPPKRKDTQTSDTELRLMLSAIFQHKFAEYDPEFIVAWNLIK